MAKSRERQPPTFQEINRRNAEFWDKRGEQMREQLADPAIAAAAHALASGSIHRAVPIAQQPSYEVILDQAEQIIGITKPILVEQASPTIREGVIRERAKRARAARKLDPLTGLIEAAVAKNPKLSLEDLLSLLRSREKRGVIIDIEEGEIGYVAANGHTRTTPISGLASRLSRAKARQRKLR